MLLYQVKYVGATKFSDGQKMVGVELDKWSENTSNDPEYFTANPGRGYFARFSSISDWKIPSSLIEEAKQLDEEHGDEDNEDPIDSAKNEEQREIPVAIGDRIITARGYVSFIVFAMYVYIFTMFVKQVHWSGGMYVFVSDLRF